MVFASIFPLSAESYKKADAALITIREVEKRYGGKSILNIDELDIYDDDRIELVGANASGKSTLARLISGYAKPSKGQLRKTSIFETRQIGFLQQSGGLYLGLTLMQNVISIARLFGRTDVINPHSERILHDLGLIPYLNQKASTLSGGVLRLGALAALVTAGPNALVLDEPFAGLDDVKSKRVRSLINSEDYGFRFILITGHAPQNLFESARILRINEGRIVSPDQILETHL